MICGFVLTSGAGMSLFGPIDSLSGVAARRVPGWESSFGFRHAALGAAERQADHGALPGHPHGGAFTSASVTLWCGSEYRPWWGGHRVVLNAVAGEDLDRAVVHFPGNARSSRAGGSEDLPHVIIEAEHDSRFRLAAAIEDLVHWFHVAAAAAPEASVSTKFLPSRGAPLRRLAGLTRTCATLPRHCEVQLASSSDSGIRRT